MKANTVVVVQGGNKNEEKFPWMFLHLDPFKEAFEISQRSGARLRSV